MKRATLFLAIATLLLAWPGRAQGDLVLYGADGSGGNPSNLYIINPATGAVQQTVGPIGFGVTGLAFDPTTGTLYGSTGAASRTQGLITINLTTGAGTLVGEFNLGGETMADIAFDSAGNLFGWAEPGSDDLFSINKATGAATSVGESGLATALSGLAISPSGTVFFGGANSVNGLGLVSLDPTTGAVTGSVPFTSALNVGLGLSFNDTGVLFGIERVDTTNRNLVTINTTTGALTTVGPTVNNLDALAFQPGSQQPAVIPEPTSLALFGAVTVVAAVSYARWRRKQNPAA
ncbi:MAG: DUF4394 domain-containing protein [Gemmataceae bacterium]|nr:DUF4394 domain-containing protein [Gemmataceae bacterium]